MLFLFLNWALWVWFMSFVWSEAFEELVQAGIPKTCRFFDGLYMSLPALSSLLFCLPHQENWLKPFV